MTRDQRFFVFDAYGTLFQVNSSNLGFSRSQQELADKVQDLWRIRQLEYTWLTSLMGNWNDFNQVTEDALDFALSSYDVSDANMRSKLLAIYQKPSTFADVLPFLTELKAQNLPTAILSNGVTEQLQSSVKVTGLENLVDQIFSASTARKYKPSPQVYQMVTEYFNCQPSDITFFSSNAWDICGATSFGFYTVWVNRKRVSFEKLGFMPNQVINKLSDFQSS